MDTHSSVCSTFDDNAKETMDLVHDMKVTCVICKLQIPVDMLDTHSISCYAAQSLIVDVKKHSFDCSHSFFSDRM